MTTVFKKSKKPYFEVILGLFYPNLGGKKFSWKKGPCQFLNIPVIYHRMKNQKKLMSHFSEKCQTDRQADGQTENSFL